MFRELAAALGCLTAIALVLTGPALVGRGALVPEIILDWDPLLRTGPVPPLPPFVDFSPTLLHLPKDLAFARGLRAGRIDQWNPQAAGGMPLWAEQTGPFFPLKLPFYAWPSRWSYDLFLALRVLVGALGAYCLARYRGLSAIGAIAAGAAYELSGASVGHLPFGSNSSPMVLLPWVVLGSYAIARRRSVATAAGAGIALGIAAHGGHPTLILVVFSAFAAAMVGHLAGTWHDRRTLGSIAALGALAVLLGLALAAPAILPLAELSQVASSYKHRAVGSRAFLKDLDLSRRVLPVAFFAPGSAQALQQHFWTPLAFAPAVGVLTSISALAGAVRGRRDGALISLAAAGLVLALLPPGLGWLHTLPGVSLIMPSYAWPLLALALTQAAGRGVQTATTSRGSAVEVLGLTLFLAATSALWWLAGNGVSPFVDVLAAAAKQPHGLLRLASAPLLAAAAVGAVLALRRMGRAHACALLLTAFLVLEQIVTMVPLTRQRRSAVLSSPPSPAIELLQHRLADGNDRMLGVPNAVGSPLAPMLFGLPDLRAMSALPVRRYYEYMHAISPGAGSYTIQDVPVIRSPLLDLASIRYMVVSSGKPPEGDPPTLEEVGRALLEKPPKLPAENDASMPLVYRDERVRIYENRAALPRVRIVHEATGVPDREAAAARIRALGQRAESAGQLGMAASVILEPDESGREAPALSGRAAPSEDVRIVDASQPDRLAIDVSLESPGLVVIADTYYPGWKATVDEAPASIFPANLMFRALYVPAGRHAVVLTYEPRSFPVGVALFAGGMLAILVILFRGRVARRAR